MEGPAFTDITVMLIESKRVARRAQGQSLGIVSTADYFIQAVNDRRQFFVRCFRYFLRIRFVERIRIWLIFTRDLSGSLGSDNSMVNG